jgi:hypothetical protein
MDGAFKDGLIMMDSKKQCSGRIIVAPAPREWRNSAFTRTVLTSHDIGVDVL